jgi:hypothetical protein
VRVGQRETGSVYRVDHCDVIVLDVDLRGLGGGIVADQVLDVACLEVLLKLLSPVHR